MALAQDFVGRLRQVGYFRVGRVLVGLLCVPLAMAQINLFAASQTGEWGFAAGLPVAFVGSVVGTVGWTYQRGWLLLLGIVLIFAGCFGPFYVL
jgi:hypothetical protein